MSQIQYNLKKEEKKSLISQQSFTTTKLLTEFCSYIDNNVFIDYNYFILYNEKDKYKIFTKHVSNVLDNILTTFPSVTIRINLESLTFSEISNHYNYICSISVLFKQKYPNKLQNCFVHNAPLAFEKLFSIVCLFIDEETQKKIKIV